MQNFWSNLWALTKPSRAKIKKLAFLVIFLELIKLIGPYVLKLLIDTVMTQGLADLEKIIYLAAALLISYESVSLVDYFWGKKGLEIIADIEYYLPKQAHEKMMELSLGYHERENTGNKIARIARGVDKILVLLTNIYWEVAPTIIQVIITGFILFLIDWRFGIVFLFYTPIFAFITYKYNKKVSPMRIDRHEEYEESMGEMAQSIININTVKSFSQENQELNRFQARIEKIRQSALIEFKLMMKFVFGRNFVIDLGRISMLIFGVYLVSTGDITIGSLVFIITVSEKAFFSLFRISRLYDKIMESSEPTNKLYELSQEEPDIKNSSNAFIPKKIQGELEFKNVEFAYSQEDKHALRDVSVKIKTCSITALVGPSGGGKTTLVRMIYRHYDPQSGQIFLDGRDLREYDLKGFRKFIAIVPQEVDLFNTSICDNIAYSNPKASLAEIKKAAQIANAEEFIKDLPSGYNTLVGERGVKLSGGQKQRIGIARAILANPKILIFDEATSNLDSQGEKLIQEAMLKAGQGRTMIIIAHRLSTIQKANKIIVLEKGKIIEEGTHAELTNKKSGLYKDLLKLQRTGEISE